jgi:hypothetical protein
MMTSEQNVASCASTLAATRAQDNKKSTAQVNLRSLGARLQAIIDGVTVAGVAPLSRGGAEWLMERSIESGEAAAALGTLLNLVDVLAAQTTMLADGGAHRTCNAAEGTALRIEAAGMRTCRRAIAQLRRDFHAARVAPGVPR